jgi:hypothetical protein
MALNLLAYVAVLSRRSLAAKDLWNGLKEILHSAQNAPFRMTSSERSG